MADPLVPASEVARVLDCSERLVYLMAARNQIPSYRVGARSIRFSVDEVLAALRDTGERMLA